MTTWHDYGAPRDDYEEDDGERACDACGQPWNVHRAGFPADCPHVHDTPPCTKCGERDRPCACDLASYHADTETIPTLQAVQAVSLLDAGPELDALIAERVFLLDVIGWQGTWRTKPRGQNPCYPTQCPELPHYSTDDAAALQLLDTVGGIVRIKRMTKDGAAEWYVGLGDGAEFWAPTLALSICRALLSASSPAET